MKPVYALTLLLLLAARPYAQPPVYKLDETAFFENESVGEMTIIFDLRKLLVNKMKEGFEFPASCVLKLGDSLTVREQVSLEVRGNFRKNYCYLPPMKVNFKKASAPTLAPLGSLKLVNVCEINRKDNTEYLLKEFLIYKMYNLLTPKSLRARLLKVTYVDSPGNKKPFTEYAFLLEDVKDMAKRNGCVERKRDIQHSELTDRNMMTKVAMFEYMIANSDWSVPVRHNIKLIVSKEDTNSVAYAVPYDFDHAGLVKTDYAQPPPQLNITDVTQRSYRGFSRSMEELQEVADEFMKQKETIYKMVREFELLSKATRNEMLSFLEGFFNVVSQPKEIKVEFIQNARKS